MASKTKSKRMFPWTATFGDEELTFRLMTPEDRDKLLNFGKSLPHEDLVFLRTDITDEGTIDDWVRAIEEEKTLTVLVEDEGDAIVGYASLHFNRLMWTRHLGEIRLFVRTDHRGHSLGKTLVSETFQLAKEKGLQRIVVNIPADQPRVRQMLEKIGFTPEALLTDWLMDRDGRTHDLLVMSSHVE